MTDTTAGASGAAPSSGGRGDARDRAIGSATAALDVSAVFPGASEMAIRCRALDWAATPLGPVAGWPPVLCTAVRLLLDTPSPACLWCGPEYVLLYNDAYRRLLGAKHPAALGRPGRVVWGEVWPQLGPQLDGVRGGGPALVFDDLRFVLERLEGGKAEEAWFTYSLAPLRDEAGAVVAVYNLAAETTARVRAERGLAAERERLRAVILRAPIPMALHEGPEHRYVLANEAHRRVSGGRDVTGLTLREAFPEVAGQGIYEVFDRVYATGEPWAGPETHLHYDRLGAGPEDAWFHLRYEPVRDAEGRVTGILNYSVDVTDQVRARREVERLLAASERARVEAEAERGRAAGVLEATSDAYFALDAEFRIVAVNAAMERSVGLSRDALLGRVFWAVFPATVGTEYERHYRAAATEGKTAHFADAYDDGRLALVSEADVYPAPGGGVAVFWRDITARVRAEAERARLLAAAEEARVAAEAANQAKSQFLAVMSHELRTPLNAIGGYAELIELGIHGPVTEAQRTALARIQASQRHLLGLIAGVLDYSRVEAGAVTYHLADVSVGEAVAEAEVLIAPQLRAKGLGYGWSGVAPDIAVRADREKLQQILLNLLGNAVKFTHARDGVPGRVEVACTVEACTVEAEDGGVAPVGGRVRLTVRDTGGGIAAEQLDRIFEPFVQVDQRLTRAYAGVGLGLAISRDLARGMGGDLTAESTPGVGSTFTLTLPSA